jgi:hypothetical protein
MVRSQPKMPPFFLLSNQCHRSFYGQTPLVLVSILITTRCMPPSLDQSKKAVGSSGSKLVRIDFVGILSFATTLLLFLFMLENIDFEALKQSQPTYKLGAAFLASITLFFALELFWATSPLIPLDLMKTSFGGYCLSQTVVTMSRSAVWDLFAQTKPTPDLTLSTARSFDCAILCSGS